MRGRASLVAAVAGLAAGAGCLVPAAKVPPNLLVVVWDDVGQDAVDTYEIGSDAAPTPALSALAAEGVRFTRAVSQPVCSPTRATLITGQHPFRTGIGVAIPPRAGWDLDTSSPSLPRTLRDAGYATALVGKWHLATPDRGGLSHPAALGFQTHLGTMGNVNRPLPFEAAESYTAWWRAEDGVEAPATGYLTDVTTADAARLVATLPEPWFVLVAYQAAHYPLHVPPGRWPPADTPRGAYLELVRTLDDGLARLMEALGARRARTHVVVLADNGTGADWRPRDLPDGGASGKGGLGRAGVRVPFVVAGPSVARGGVSDALVQPTDLFATALAWAGLPAVAPAPDDSVSFAAVAADPGAPGSREVALAERFEPNGRGPWSRHQVALEDRGFKAVFDGGHAVALYDLSADPWETVDLLEAGGPRADAAVAALRARAPAGHPLRAGAP